MLGDNYYSSQIYENITKFNRIFSVILLVFVLVFIVSSIVFLDLGKDVPLFGKVSRKIIGEKNDTNRYASNISR